MTGTLTIAGLGPGDAALVTPEVSAALADATDVLGYAPYVARVPAREKHRLIVMEGPTDVMAAADAGFTECVAVLGTALTPEHAKQLGSAVGDGIAALLMTRRYLEAHHHKAPALVDA